MQISIKVRSRIFKKFVNVILMIMVYLYFMYVDGRSYLVSYTN